MQSYLGYRCVRGHGCEIGSTRTCADSVLVPEDAEPKLLSIPNPYASEGSDIPPCRCDELMSRRQRHQDIPR